MNSCEAAICYEFLFYLRIPKMLSCWPRCRAQHIAARQFRIIINVRVSCALRLVPVDSSDTRCFGIRPNEIEMKNRREYLGPCFACILACIFCRFISAIETENRYDNLQTHSHETDSSPFAVSYIWVHFECSHHTCGWRGVKCAHASMLRGEILSDYKFNYTSYVIWSYHIGD